MRKDTMLQDILIPGGGLKNTNRDERSACC